MIAISVNLIKRHENQFLVIGAVFGILFLICTPPFQVADEDRHYFRSFQVAEGYFISQVHEGQAGGWLPAGVIQCGESTADLRWNMNQKITVQDILRQFQVPLNLSDRMFMPFRSASYSPIAYLPSAALMRIGIWLDMSPVMLMYMGRLANLVSWLISIWLAIRIIPFYKGLFFVLAMTPMSIYQGASLSADSVTNGLACLTIAFFLFLSYGDHEQICKKSLFSIFILTALLVLTKYIFLPFCLLYFLIPIKKFKSRKTHFFIFLILICVNLLAFLIWYYAARKLPIFWNTGIYPGRQAAYILQHPISYLSILLSTLRQNIFYYYSGFVGAFGWAFFYVSKWHTRLWILLILFLALTDGSREKRISIRQKSLLFGLFCSIALLIFTLLYLYWNEVGAGVIEGVQSRYFIPIGPLLFMLLNNPRLCVRDSVWKTAFILAGTIISLCSALVLITHRFYPAG